MGYIYRIMVGGKLTKDAESYAEALMDDMEHNRESSYRLIMCFGKEKDEEVLTKLTIEADAAGNAKAINILSNKRLKDGYSMTLLKHAEEAVARVNAAHESKLSVKLDYVRYLGRTA